MTKIRNVYRSSTSLHALFNLLFDAFCRRRNRPGGCRGAPIDFLQHIRIFAVTLKTIRLRKRFSAGGRCVSKPRILLAIVRQLSANNLPAVMFTPATAIYTVFRCPEKRGHGVFPHNFSKRRQSFVIFGTNHPEDSFYQENRKYIPNVITSLRNDDVIVTSSETTLSRRASGKDTTIFRLITLEN